MHRITEKICKERWQHWCTKISGVKVLPTLLISTITSNMSFIQLSLMLSGYPASSDVPFYLFDTYRHFILQNTGCEPNFRLNLGPFGR